MAYDLLERNSTFGGTQGSHGLPVVEGRPRLLVRDLTLPFTVVGVVALVARRSLVRARRTRAAAARLLAVVAALAYSWVVALAAPLLPDGVLPAARAGAADRGGRGERCRGRALAGAVGAALLVAATAVAAWSQADDVRRFYQFADAASLRGLGAPGERPAARRGRGDRPLLELPRHVAAAARRRCRRSTRGHPAEGRAAVRAPGAGGAARARRAGARSRDARHPLRDRRPDLHALERRASEPPRIGRPVFVSRRLVVLRIPDA